jgi:hypothetical protein
MNAKDKSDEQINRSNSLKRAVIMFFLYGGILFVVLYGSYYLGLYGFSISPLFSREKNLLTPLHRYIIEAICGGIVAAGVAYSRKNKKDQQRHID